MDKSDMAPVGAGGVAMSSATSSGISVNFEKLNGIANYGNWKFLMRMYLIHEDLWDCIEESSPGAPKVTDDRKQQKALAKICLMVQPSSFSHVRNAKTGYEAWTNLKTAYEDRGLCRRLGLLRTLFGLKLELFSDMEAYLTKITDLDQQLRDINAPLDDDFLSVIILSGLPADYDPLIMTLENSNIKLCSENVKSKLLQENLRRDFDKCEESALLTNRLSRGVNKHSRVKCYVCKQSGHFARNCPLKTINKSGEDCEKAWNGTLLTALAVDINSNAWYVDSGATSHMTNNKNLLKNYVVDNPRLVTVANNQKINSEGHGDVELLLNGKQEITKISDVIYVPDLSTSLLSVSKMTAKGLQVHFDSQECSICFGGTVIASATKVNDVYQLNMEIPKCTTANQLAAVAACQSVVPSECGPSSTLPAVAQFTNESQPVETVKLCKAQSTQELWHRRLGHLNRRSMDLLKNGMANGINYTGGKHSPCVACIEGKQSRLPFPEQSYNRATDKLGLIHSDLCGPMSVSSYSGARYLLTFIDDYTRMTFGYFIKTKDEVFSVFKMFKSYVENQTDLKIKKIRTDNGCEYVNNQFQMFLREHGIEHQTTVPYSPQQNGVAERANRTIMEAARCMLQDAGMDKRLWAEAVNTAIYIKNKSPSRAVKGTTPEEKWTGNKVDLSNLRTFGCVAYAMIPGQKRRKLDAKSKRYIFVGYCTESKGYRLIDPEDLSKCIKSRDVQFLENKMASDLKLLKDDSATSSQINLTSNIEDNENASQRDEEEELMPVIEILDSSHTDSDSCVSDNASDATWTPGMATDATSSDYEDVEESAAIVRSATEMCQFDEPLTIQDALSSPEKEHWKKAIADEYESFEKNKAWNLTLLPEGKKAVKCKWVFKKKLGPNGELKRYKARLVAKGFTQRYGIDYKETYSPVVRYSTIRTLLALAVNLNMHVDHMDVKTAFLNGDLAETVFMEQPDGYKVEGKEEYVFKLNKAIYGLKQASKSWYDKIDNALLNLQFRRSVSEPCVYIKTDDAGDLIILALYVDDILLFSKDTPEKEKLKEELMRTFEMRDLGRANHILGMNLRQEENKITLDQKNYIIKVLEQFNMSDCKPVGTPLEIGMKFEKGEKNDIDSNYRSLMGCIMYIAVEQQEILRNEEELMATVRLPAEAEAYRLQTIAEGKRTQTIEGAKADAERIKSLGVAEATAIGDVGKADAERMLAKAKVYRQYGDAAIMALVLEALPKIAAEVSAPLAKTDEIILVGDGGATGEVARLASSLPPALKTLTGLDLTAMLKRLEPKKDHEEMTLTTSSSKKNIAAC
ncbi:unnamed protein product [Plutella xylostella]|uniref:(diamondback moth) hypothetical protein n=1 Tax=Plutella xylostella TaxID=51655 RepID=A0A8S4DUH7_PLUXY|nr:unnamed protein product [Plutella xylostella]